MIVQTHKNMKHFWLVLLVFGLSVAPSYGQDPALDRYRASAAAYYNYSDPGDVTIRVHVWGAMRHTGLYNIPRETHLSELISLAGGPQLAERSRRSRRNVVIELHRLTPAGTDVVLTMAMENELVLLPSDPLLQHGDVLTVKAVTRRTFGVRDIFPIISAAATIALLVDRLSNK